VQLLGGSKVEEVDAAATEVELVDWEARKFVEVELVVVDSPPSLFLLLSSLTSSLSLWTLFLLKERNR